MNTHKRRLTGTLAAVAIIAATTLFGVAAPASAATCSGTGCNNTDPYTTGCNSGASLIHTYYTAGGRFDMFYSGTCSTNWIQWTGPNICTWKRVQSSYGTWTTWENDHATWSYSRQIYAPGTAWVQVEWAAGSAAYGSGTCAAGAWDYAHDVGRHGWYTV